MNEIGGYFGLELGDGKSVYHDTAYNFKSGRSALSFILQTVKPAKVYVPFYTCDALLEPFYLNNIAFEFYPINAALEPEIEIDLHDSEMLLLINYFDCKRTYIRQRSEVLKEKLIVDNTQAFFWKEQLPSWMFNSARKFFGVPDGAYLNAPLEIQAEDYEQLNSNSTYQFEHLLLRFNNQTEQGYPYYQQNEVLCDSVQARMSLLTQKLLSLVDYNEAIDKRKHNLHILHEALKELNTLHVDFATMEAAGFYPFLPQQKISHPYFWDEKVFIPVFWKDCAARKGYDKGFEWEKHISNTLLPIPADHRYDKEDMFKIINLIKKAL